MNQLPYHTAVFSSIDSNDNTRTTLSSLVPEKNEKFSPCYISTEENDPMLGYIWNNNDQTPPSPPTTQYPIPFDYHFHSSLSTHSNTSSTTMPSTPTTTTSSSSSSSSPSPETMLWESSFMQQKENVITTSTNLPLSPESLYESPLLPPSSGIISTSDILDDTTGLGLPCSLFILNKESSFASGLECSFNNNHNTNNDNMYSSTTTTTSLSSSNNSTITLAPKVFNDQEENNTVIEDMDYYFSEEDDEDEDEQYNKNDDEDEDDDQEDDDDEEDDDQEDTWPTTLTHGISFNSSIGDSEYGDMEQEHHPLTGLLVDLRKQVDTRQLLKKEEWIRLYKHIKDVLNQVSHEEEEDEEAFEIRQCVVNCVQQLQSRYQNLFVFLPNEVSLQQQVNDYQEEEEEMIDIVREDDRHEQHFQKGQEENDDNIEDEEEELLVPSRRRRHHLYYNGQQQDETSNLQRQDTESSSEDEEGDSDNDEPWIPEEIIKENASLSTLVTASESIMSTTAIKKKRRGSGINSRRRSSSLLSSTSSSSLSSYGNSRKTRKNYSRETTRILMDWYLKHGGKTPEPHHKDELAKKANKSHVQISTWFQNARRRHHSKLMLYQKLNKEYPDKVYDFDTYEQFRSNKKSLTNTNSKKRSISDVTIDNEEEYSDDE